MLFWCEICRLRDEFFLLAFAKNLQSMIARITSAIPVFALVFAFGQSVEAQTFESPKADPLAKTARQEYLQREEAFTTRMNFTAKQKTQYTALIEKRNAALNTFKPGIQKVDSKGNVLTRKQVIVEFQDGLQAMLTKDQRSTMQAEQQRSVTQ